MSTVTGSWVRVPGETLTVTVSGTLTAALVAMTETEGYGAFTALDEIGVGMLGASVVLRWEHVNRTDGPPDPETYGHRRYFVNVGVPGPVDTAVTEAWSDEYNVAAWDLPGHLGPPFDPGAHDLTVSFGFIITVTAVLKSRLVQIYPDRRQHMHPRDDHFEHTWAITPDTTISVTCAGVTVTSDAYREWGSGLPGYVEPTEDAIWTPVAGIGGAVAANAGATGYTEIAGVSLGAGWSFDGLVAGLVGGPSGTAEHPGSQCLGSGSGITITWDDEAESSATEGYGIGLNATLGPVWQWSPAFSKFDETDTADNLIPRLNAGFAVVQSDHSLLPLTHDADELPTTAARIGYEVLTGVDHSAGLPVGSVTHSGDTFQVSIDPDWALDNGVYAAQEVDLTDTVPIIAQEDDLYCPLDAPGCDHGVGSIDGHRTPVYTISINEPSFYPLAADKDAPTADPNLRWQQTGELPSLRDMPSSPLRWVFPPTIYSETTDPGGTISLPIQHRFHDRLNLLKTQNKEVSWRWYFHFERRAAGSVDTADDPTYGEDLHSAQQAGYLRFQLNKPRWSTLTLTLTIDYSVVDVHDEHYTDGEDRTDAFDWSRTESSATYTIVVPAAGSDFYEGTAAKQHEITVVVDLTCPDDGSTPQLQLLDRLTISGLRLPLCTRGDKPTGFVEGGVVELFTDGTKGLKLSRDQGYDHTGRNTTAAPSAEVSAIETWNFLNDDWECARLRNGAAMRCLRLPGEPWRHGIEEALGYIEPLQHGLDFTGDASLLHYARPLTEFGIAGYNDVIQASLDDAAYAAMGHAGYMYWLATRKRLKAGEAGPGDTLVLDAAIRVATWKLAPGIQSVLTVRKALWGCAEILLKAPGGRRRLTPDYLAETGLAPQYVIYRRTAYQDADGATIADPGGSLPASGTWSHYLDGTIATRLDHHGVWRTPPLPPSKVRFRDPSRPDDPAATHTDVRLTSYLVQVWRSGRWSLYNPDDPISATAAKADADYLGEIDLGANTGKRLWQSVDGGLTSTLILGGNLVRLRCGAHAITRGGAVHTRLGSGAKWRSRRGTSSPSPMLLWVSETDDLALLDGANARQSRRHGRAWSNGLPAGVATVTGTWHEAGDLTAALLDPADKLPLGAGAKLVEGGDVDVFVVSTKAAGGTATPTTVATLTAAQVAGDTVWPWPQRLAAGGWMVGCLAGGRYHEWRASDPGGTTWSEHGTGDEVTSAAGVSYCAHWRGRDGMEALSAYHGTAREVRIWWRPGADGAWRGPCFTHAADPTMPYIYIRRDGKVECGWLVGTTWTRYRADHPESTWETW
ncbi:MAG: hypothetical protein HZB16_07255 [Armatimonadetes bacterium]|nr:hypothetical protein [Armatimonadota bacterium]